MRAFTPDILLQQLYYSLSLITAEPEAGATSAHIHGTLIAQVGGASWPANLRMRGGCRRKRKYTTNRECQRLHYIRSCTLSCEQTCIQSVAGLA